MRILNLPRNITLHQLPQAFIISFHKLLFLFGQKHDTNWVHFW